MNLLFLQEEVKRSLEMNPKVDILEGEFAYLQQAVEKQVSIFEEEKRKIDEMCERQELTKLMS